jgi:hypothetical protein
MQKRLVIACLNPSRQPKAVGEDWRAGAIPIAVRAAGGARSRRIRVERPRRFSNGETQTDSFVVRILPRPRVPQMSDRIALFDPKGRNEASC